MRPSGHSPNLNGDRGLPKPDGVQGPSIPDLELPQEGAGTEDQGQRYTDTEQNKTRTGIGEKLEDPYRPATPESLGHLFSPLPQRGGSGQEARPHRLRADLSTDLTVADRIQVSGAGSQSHNLPRLARTHS